MKKLKISYLLLIFLLINSQSSVLFYKVPESFKIYEKIQCLYFSNNSRNSESWSQILPIGREILIDSNNSIYVLGYNGSPSSINVSILKCSDSGAKLWMETWGGSEREYYYDAILDSANNIYLTGETNSYGSGFTDIFLLKYSSSGFLEWFSIWGSEDFESAYSIAIDSNNSIYVCGRITIQFDQHLCLLKYDTSGILQWYRIWDDKEVGNIISMEVDSTNSVYIYLETFNGENDNIFLLKYSNQGELLWSKGYGVSGYTEGLIMKIDSDDNIIISGRYSFYEDGTDELWIIKYNSSGIEQWKHSWNEAFCYDILIDRFDYFYIKDLNCRGRGSYLIKYNKSLEILTDMKLEINAYIYSIKVDYLQNIYIISEISIPNEDYFNDIYIAKYNFSGNFQWSLTWGTASNEFYLDFAIDSRNNIYLLCGQSKEKIFLVKNPLDNKKSLKLNPWNNPQVIFFVSLITVSCGLSLVVLLSILVPWLKSNKNRS